MDTQAWPDAECFMTVLELGVHFHDMPTVCVKVNPPKASNEHPKGQFVEPNVQR